ncbi:10950_t:CDS:2, partial [Dentiscutata erythropus]
KIGGKHASRVHGGQNPTSQHLEFLSRVAMRHKMDRHNSGMYYAEASTPKAINENTSEIEDIYDLYGRADHTSRIHGGRNDSCHQYLRQLAYRHKIGHASSVEHYGVMNDRPNTLAP